MIVKLLPMERPDMTPSDRQFTTELGRRLAHLRQEACLTQQAVAAHVGVAQQTLAHYEVVGRASLPTTADQRAVLKLVDAMLETRRCSAPPAHSKRKAS